MDPIVRLLRRLEPRGAPRSLVPNENERDLSRGVAVTIVGCTRELGARTRRLLGPPRLGGRRRYRAIALGRIVNTDPRKRAALS